METIIGIIVYLVIYGLIQESRADNRFIASWNNRRR